MSTATTTRAAALAAWAAVCAPLLACSGDSGGLKKDPSSVTEQEPSADWPSYGRDGQNTRFNADEKRISKSNVNELVKKWDSAETGVAPVGVTSTAAVVGDVVYFGDWSGKLQAVRASDGSSVWSTQLSSTTTGPNAQLNASPFVSKKRVYIGGTDNQVFSVDRESGAKVWDPYASTGDQPQVILWSSPNVVEDTLIIGVGSFQVFLPGSYTFRGNVVGLDAESGDNRWTTYLTEGTEESGYGCSVWGSAAVDTERKWAFIGVGQAYSAPASKLSDAVVAIDYVTGELKWGHQFTENDIFTITQMGEDFDVGASVILYEAGGKELVAAADKGGHLYALERQTGELAWGTMLTPGGRTGGVMASPAFADGRIYIFSNNGIAANLGSMGPGSGSAFAVDGASGDIVWRKELTPGAFGGVAVANGVVFFTTLDGSIHALDADTGEELWRDKLLGGSATNSAGGVTVANGMVFAGAGWAWTPLGAPPPGGLTAYGLP